MHRSKPLAHLSALLVVAGCSAAPPPEVNADYTSRSGEGDDLATLFGVSSAAIGVPLPSCSSSANTGFIASTGVLTLTLSQANTTEVVIAPVGSQLFVNDVACVDGTGAAIDLAKVTKIVVNGTSGDDAVVLDLYLGSLNPKTTGTGGGGVVLALGGGGMDRVGVRGTSAADTYTAGSHTGRAFVDFTGDGVADLLWTSTASRRELMLATAGGNDFLSGSGRATATTATALSATATLAGAAVASGNIGALTNAYKLSAYGGPGNDRIQGGAGDDRLDGGDGDDTFFNASSADGADVYIGGNGSDTVDYSARTVNLALSLSTSGAVDANDGESGEGDDLTQSIENLTGGSGNDVITGNQVSNVLRGGPGNDLLNGGPGGTCATDADQLFGEAGDDTFEMNAAADCGDDVSGGVGADTVTYHHRAASLVVSRDDLANDGETNEKDNVRTDNEVLVGGQGNDTLSGGATLVKIAGCSGDDTINGSAGDDDLSGGPGNDVINAGTGNDWIRESGEEPLCYSNVRWLSSSPRGLGADVINGGPGVKDKVDYSARSGALTITLCVDSAAATGVGVCGNPRNDGEAGEGDAILNTEIVEGGAGGDTITGSAADEWLYGNGGDDVLVGLDGNDHLDGGPGINTVTGGNGADICDNYVLATACDLHVYVCNAGTLRDCDRAPENACETDVATSVAHCGACGFTCPNMANAQRACVSGSCQIGSCNNGFSDCDGAVANGCEINTKTDASNCGTCGAACPAMPNAAPGCENGACGVGACVSGWGNCDGNALNGCEFPVSNDISNCGSCGYTCPIVPNSTRTCSGVACVIDACTGNFANCDGRYANGCETDLGSNPSHCGGCGIACPAAPNMGAVCQSGSCGLGACLPGWADCDANPANGCEVNLFVDNGNCGACGNTCGAGTLCRVGACETNQLDFTLPGITANGCSPAIEHAGASGDDRGGVAVSSSGFFVTGDTTTARVDATTLGSATSTGTQYDALTSDLATETVYAFGNGSGPHRWREVYDAPTFRWYVPATYFDRLFRLNGTTGAVDSVVTLGARIDVPEDTRAGMGFFAGKGRALVASSGRLYDVRLPSGQVVNLGAFTLPAHQPCETQGIWGVAEQSGGALSIVYVKDSGTIARTQVLPAGATTTVRSFTNLSDTCGFAVSLPRGRWFWHHEGASQFGGVTEGEFLGSCSLF